MYPIQPILNTREWNALVPFRSDLLLTPIYLELVCEPGRDTANVTLTFTKRTKLSEDLSPTDSIKVAIPLSLGLAGEIAYSFPAYTGHGLNLPYVPLAQKAASDEVTLTYQFKIYTGVRHIAHPITSRIYISTISEMAPHLTCPKVLAEADSIFNVTILTPSQNATLSELTVNNQPVADFHPNVTEYWVIMPCGTDRVKITGTPYSDCATVQGVPSGVLGKEFKRFEVVVTAEDGIHQKTYVVQCSSADSG